MEAGPDGGIGATTASGIARSEPDNTTGLAASAGVTDTSRIAPAEQTGASASGSQVPLHPPS